MRVGLCPNHALRCEMRGLRRSPWGSRGLGVPFLQKTMRGNIKDRLRGLAAEGSMICALRTPYWNTCTLCPSSSPPYLAPSLYFVISPANQQRFSVAKGQVRELEVEKPMKEALGQRQSSAAPFLITYIQEEASGPSAAVAKQEEETEAGTSADSPN
ncbi:Hypothetical protein SMAX5B_002921 [Scophthalmus maximus]|uniref:Uncharacterized protein n=1 Tax=Scophthalmus maximus TaxID=52904 RepID=A0A2U9BDL5_SCOMX|nr:Hypothetical protein SMAX5B_002921 [Scophthalmus maximus]